MLTFSLRLPPMPQPHPLQPHSRPGRLEVTFSYNPLGVHSIGVVVRGQPENLPVCTQDSQTPTVPHRSADCERENQLQKPKRCMSAMRNRFTAELWVSWLGHRRYTFQDPKNILLTINKISSFYVSLNTTAVRARTGLRDFLLRGNIPQSRTVKLTVSATRWRHRPVHKNLNGCWQPLYRLPPPGSTAVNSWPRKDEVGQEGVFLALARQNEDPNAFLLLLLLF